VSREEMEAALETATDTFASESPFEFGGKDTAGS